MTKLVDAMRTKDSQTQNGMTTNSSTLNHCVDLFSQIGALRGKEKQRKINAFVKAFDEDALTALRIAFWVRDVRGGAGERQTGIDLLTYMAENHTDVMRKNLNLIPEYGRWADILPFLDTRLKDETLGLIAKALEEGDGLCAKWMPRPNVKNSDKKRWSKAIRLHLNLSPKEYRKLIVGMSTTIEQIMCANEWEAINYSHVPSKAMSDYMKAFGRHDHAGFTKYLDSLEKGEAKINAGAVFPYDITKNLRFGDKRGADAQWKALPNFLEDSQERLLPMVDVSGSMGCPAGGNRNVTCMDVAISLGLYISERNEGSFKDAFLTFSAQPELQIVKGKLSERFNQMLRSKWGMNTDIEAAFKKVLSSAKANNVPANEMPTMIIILSDMEFDRCTGGGGWGNSTSNWNNTALEMVQGMYKEAGYEMPKLTFWNLNSMGDKNKPVKYNQTGTALVSGFSPALMQTLLGGKEMITPYSMMMDIIGADRYAAVTL